MILIKGVTMKTWKDTIILGAIAGSGKFEFIRNQRHTLSFWNVNLILEDLENSKLIARHVDSMSDEEKEIYDSKKEQYQHHELDEVEEFESPESFLYLLSIGVLPESLADEDVIWE